MPKPKKVVERTVSKAISRTGSTTKKRGWGTPRLRRHYHNLLRESQRERRQPGPDRPGHGRSRGSQPLQARHKTVPRRGRAEALLLRKGHRQPELPSWRAFLWYPHSRDSCQERPGERHLQEKLDLHCLLREAKRRRRASLPVNLGSAKLP